MTIPAATTHVHLMRSADEDMAGHVSSNSLARQNPRFFFPGFCVSGPSLDQAYMHYLLDSRFCWVYDMLSSCTSIKDLFVYPR